MTKSPDLTFREFASPYVEKTVNSRFFGAWTGVPIARCFLESF